MSQNNSFYSKIGIALIFLNFLSVFFMALFLFSFTLIEYSVNPLEQLIFQDGIWNTLLYNIFDLFVQIPQTLDSFFMAIVALLCIDLIYFSYKMKESEWWQFLVFLLLGLPIWTFLMLKVYDIKITIISYLSNAFIIKPASPFFDMFSQYSYLFATGMFLLCIFVNRFDWNNLREKISNSTSDFNDSESFDERFEQ